MQKYELDRYLNSSELKKENLNKTFTNLDIKYQIILIKINIKGGDL